MDTMNRKVFLFHHDCNCKLCVCGWCRFSFIDLLIKYVCCSEKLYILKKQEQQNNKETKEIKKLKTKLDAINATRFEPCLSHSNLLPIDPPIYHNTWVENEKSAEFLNEIQNFLNSINYFCECKVCTCLECKDEFITLSKAKENKKKISEIFERQECPHYGRVMPIGDDYY